MPPKKSRGKGRRRAPLDVLVFAGDDQTYARVTAMLGNNRVRVKCQDGTERQCTIRGTMRRRVWIQVGDLVLVALRADLAGTVGDIVHKYPPADVQKLLKCGEPVNILVSDDTDMMEMESMIQFVDDEYPGPSDPAASGPAPDPSSTKLENADSSAADLLDFELI